MTDEHANHDGTDSQNAADAPEADRGPAAQDRPETNGVDTTRRRFMQGAAAAVAGGGALATAGDAAAAGSGGRLLIVGRGPGKHTYEVEMEGGGSIQTAQHTNQSDTTSTTSDGHEVATGEVWNGFVDVLSYSGGIDRVEGDGEISFHFLDGAFVDDERLVVTGEAECDYTLGTNSGDLSLAEGTNPADADLGPGRTERGHTPDELGGHVMGGGVDPLSVPAGQPVQYLHVQGGHLTVNAYRPGRSTTPDNGREASVVLFYMGDGRFTTFFQNMMAIYPAVEGYDYSVLLKHDNQDDGVSARAHSSADTVRDPTHDNFEHCMRSLANAGFTIDLYIVSHGDRSSFKMSAGDFGSEDWYSITDIEQLRASFDGDFPLRMVYQANCWGSELNDAWQRLGADVSAGARFVNFFPNQFPTFAKRWKAGDTFRTALNQANTVTSRQASKRFLEGDVTFTDTDEWNQDEDFCTQWAVWQQQGECAREYFVDRWGHSRAEWNSVNMDGWDFACHASEKLVGGDASITR